MTDPFSVDNAPTTEPASIVAGTYEFWKRDLGYDSTLYDVVYRINDTDFTGVPDGDWFVFAIPSASSTSWTAGDTRWTLRVVRKSDSEAIEIGTGIVTVFDSTSDRRTHAEIMVEKIEGILEGRAAADVASYSIKGRSLTKLSPAELTAWRDYYKAEIEMTGGSSTNSGPSRNTVRVRFI